MRNLNEPRRRDDEDVTTADIAGKSEAPNEGEVIPFERQDATAGRSGPSFLRQGELQELRARWDAVQTGFVDEPRQAVEDADRLVASLITRIADVFSEERAGLEDQWSRSEQVSTEDLRVALQRYRSFFSRLLSV